MEIMVTSFNTCYSYNITPIPAVNQPDQSRVRKQDEVAMALKQQKPEPIRLTASAMHLHLLTKLLTIFLLFAFHLVNGQSLRSRNNDYVVVLVPENSATYLKHRRFHAERQEVQFDSSRMYLKFTGNSRMPRTYKKTRIQFINTGTRETQKLAINKDSAYSIIRQEQNSKFREFQLTELKRKSSELFLKGGNGGTFMKNQWHTLMATRRPSPGENVHLRMKTGWFRKTGFVTDTMPTGFMGALPVIDLHACDDFDRFYARKKLHGWGLDNVRYEPFTIPQRKIIRKSFEIFFGKNSSEARDEDLATVIQYLKQNNLSILHVKIEGYSSVEGDSLLNQKLYMKRAYKLLRILQTYNNEPIGSDTIITGEAWTAFRTALSFTSLKGLDTLSNADLRERINSNDSLLLAIEPYLAPTRKATLSITLASRLSNEELIQKVKQEFRIVKRGISTHLPYSKVIATEAKLMGIIRYVDQMVQAGTASSSDLAEMVDEEPNAEQTRILLFFHMIKMQEEKPYDGMLDSLFKERNWSNIFSVAHTNIISLLQSSLHAHDQKRRVKQAVDIQYYAVRYVEAGKLDPEVLCTIQYPQKKLFYGMILNHYAILHHLSKKFSFSCGGVALEKSSTIRNNKFTEASLADMLAYSLPPAEGGNQRPTYDITAKSDYFHFTKMLFLNDDKSIKDFVMSSDNLTEFDLYSLLRVNVSKWDPIINHYYDPDIQMKQMDRMINLLKTQDKRICPEQTIQLYLDYHLKALHHIQRYMIPGDQQSVRIAEKSLDYISSYFSRNNELLFLKLTIYLLDGINSFSDIPTTHSSLQYAYKILHRLPGSIAYNDEILKRIRIYERIMGGHPKMDDKLKETKLLIN